jgi:hypothetical protein
LAERHSEIEMAQLRRSKLRKWARVTTFTANPERALLEWMEVCKGYFGESSLDSA